MKHTYDKFCGAYDRLFAPAERRFLGRWRSEALSFLPVGGSILELGCGTGLNFRFYPPARIAVSTEISAGMIGRALEKAATNQLVQADAQYLPFDANAYDAAFATLVFCSIPQPALAFAEVRRVVKPGGLLILLEHVRPTGVLGYAFDLFNVLTVPLSEDHFNRRTAEIAASAGLDVVEVRSKAAGIVNLIVCRVVK